MTLKYPRRKKRTIGGTTYQLTRPDKTRSKTMSKIPSKGTSIEQIFAKELRKNGIRFRRPKTMSENPDFILFGHKVAIYCDGDFWHGYKINELKIKRNSDFWTAKIKRNMERDKEVNIKLKNKGWTVLRFWEHEIKKTPETCMDVIRKYLLEKEMGTQLNVKS